MSKAQSEEAPLPAFLHLSPTIVLPPEKMSEAQVPHFIARLSCLWELCCRMAGERLSVWAGTSVLQFLNT